jgi:hypothetical protein
MKRPVLTLCLLLGSPVFAADIAESASGVGQWRTHQLTFTTTTGVSNPFDTYLLKLRLMRPNGSTLEVEGFYDDLDGTAPFTWRVRLCPDQAGTWSWSTIAGDAPATWNEASSGSFTVADLGDPGPLTTDGRSFKWRGTDQPVYVYGNFLDESAGTKEQHTHVYFSEEITNNHRGHMRTRHQNLWKANKVNIYYANDRDFDDLSTTPWVGTEDAPVYSAMNLRKWADYDTHLKDWKAAGALVWMWFFADDSGFQRLTPAQQERLVRYAMARHSAYSHVSFVMALETDESGQLSTSMVERLGAFTETKNPWRRLLSSHQMQSYGDGETIGCIAILSDQPWMDFYASQVGNSCNSGDASRRRRVFECGKTLYDHFPTRPHASEEFGICSGDAQGQNATCRELTWGAFLSGAGAGVGTDFQNLTAFHHSLAGSLPAHESGRLHPVRRDGQRLRAVTRRASTISCTRPRRRARSQSPPRGPACQAAGGIRRSPPLALPRIRGRSRDGSYTPPTQPTAHWVLWITSGNHLNTVRLHPTPARDVTIRQRQAASAGLPRRPFVRR